MSSVCSPAETKFIYYIDEEETPYLVKLNVSPEAVTLGDFKNALNRPHSKFFFKSIDDDFGVVKEEIFDDNSILPCFNGRVVSWLVTAEGSSTSDGQLDIADDGLSKPVNGVRVKSGSISQSDCVISSSGERMTNVTTAVPADSTSTSLHPNGDVASRACDPETESLHSVNQDRIAPLRTFQNYKSGGRHHFGTGTTHCGQFGQQGSSSGTNGALRHRHHRSGNGAPGSGTYEAPSSMMSSDLESTSFFDSEDESSRFSSVTGTTFSSRRYGRFRRRRRRPPPISRASSYSSITDSTMSLNIVAVTLNMDTVNFLGISIVGQSNKAGDGGIYVGSIMKGGAVAQDGRIEPGDMILEVNGISFEEMSNDDAVRTLRDQVQLPGPITLVVAKCWDPNPRGGYFTIPRQEPVRPIDPRAWILHTNAMTNAHVEATGSNQPSANPSTAFNGDPTTGASSGGESSSTLSPSGALGLTPGMSMGTLTSGQTSMPLGTSAAAYNMAALLAASQQQQQQQQNQQEQQHQLMLQQQQAAAAAVQLNHPPFYPVQNMMLVPNYPPQPLTPSVVTGSSSLPEIERYSEPVPLTVDTDPSVVVRTMLQPDSGLDIRDRVWLKLTVPNAFIGSDLVDWLYRHLDGFPDRRTARKYAVFLLKTGHIRHTVNKTTFSEQCYYVFRDVAAYLSSISLEEVDSVSEVGARHPPTWGNNTTSTNLTAGAPHPHMRLPNVNQLSDLALPRPAPNGSVGTEGTNSSQYSSVPPLYHPPLTTPLRQLIADGQDAAAAAAAAVGSRLRPATRSRDNVSGYSSSSSSIDSDLNHFTLDPHRANPGFGGGEMLALTLCDSMLNGNKSSDQQHVGSRLLPPGKSCANPLPIHNNSCLSRQPVPNLPSAAYLRPSNDMTACSTASSSTSDGDHAHFHHQTHMPVPSELLSGNRSSRTNEPVISVCDSSISSSKSSSSSSSCAPATSAVPVQSVHRQLLPTVCPPPPPPRVSTLAGNS